mmetsp:Transcript_40894/g.94155  ORF Transcript_40894/g.94155 Transcript_40894/m.94155 type:complete len:562 (+) Transcript_40894:108-1793(+)
MDEIENATDEHVAAFPDYLATFHKWMLDRGRKENTARAYVRQLAILFQEDGKSPRGLASETYFTITKASFKNKKGNGQRSASVRCFTDFWQDHMDAGRPLEKAGDTKMYQLDTGRGGMPRGKKLEEEDPHRNAEELKLRELLDLPESTGWQVSVCRRISGDLIAATSPDGRAHKTQKAVLEYLGRPSKRVPEGRTLAELLDNPALKDADEKKDGKRKRGEKNKDKKEKKEKKKDKEKEKKKTSDDKKAPAAAPSAPGEGQAASSASSSSSDAEESGDVLDAIFGKPEPGDPGGKRSGKKRKRAKAPTDGNESDAASTASSSSSSSSSNSKNGVKVSLSEDADQLGGQLSTGGPHTHTPLSKRDRLAKELLRRVRNTTQGHTRYVALAVVAEKIVESGKRSKKCPWTQDEINDVVRDLMAKELQNAKDFAARGEVPQPPTPDPKCPPTMDDEINGVHRPMHRWTEPSSGSSFLKQKLVPARFRRRHRAIQFVEESPVFQITDWRVAYGELWISQPGMEVYCDRCGEQFAQTKGKLTGRDQRSSFAQDEFICFNCRPDEGLPC